MKGARSPGMGDTRLLPALKKPGKRTEMSSLESLRSGEAPGENFGNTGDAQEGARSRRKKGSLERQTSVEIAEEAESPDSPDKGEKGSNASEKPDHQGSAANGSVEGSVKSAAQSSSPAKGGATPAKSKPESTGFTPAVGGDLGAQINKAINAMNQSLFEEIRQETEAR